MLFLVLSPTERPVECFSGLTSGSLRVEPIWLVGKEFRFNSGNNARCGFIAAPRFCIANNYNIRPTLLLTLFSIFAFLFYLFYFLPQALS